LRKIYLVSNTKTADESVVNLSVSRIEFLKFEINLSEFDALVATSKNAFKALKFNGILPINLPVFLNFRRLSGRFSTQEIDY